MPKSLITVPEVNEFTLKRMSEVLYYLVLMTITKKKTASYEDIVFLEVLCNHFNVSKTLLSATAIEIQQTGKKPTKQELVATLAYYKVPVRQSCKIIQSSATTYYDYLGEFISNRLQLRPTLLPEQHQEINKFLQHMKKFFRPLIEVLKHV